MLTLLVEVPHLTYTLRHEREARGPTPLGKSASKKCLIDDHPSLGEFPGFHTLVRLLARYCTTSLGAVCTTSVRNALHLGSGYGALQWSCPNSTLSGVYSSRGDRLCINIDLIKIMYLLLLIHSECQSPEHC